MDNGWDKYQTLVLDKLSSLESYLAEVKVDIKTMNTRVSNIEKVQIENTSDVRYHIKRTDIAEQRIQEVETRLENEVKELRTAIYSLESSIKADMETTRNAVQGWKANLALLGWLFSALTIITGIVLRFYNF